MIQSINQSINFSYLDVGCMFRPALVCWIVVYSDQLLLLGAFHTLIYLITIILAVTSFMNLFRKVLVGILNFPLNIVFLDVPPQMGLDYPIKNWRIFFSLLNHKKSKSLLMLNTFKAREERGVHFTRLFTSRQ